MYNPALMGVARQIEMGKEPTINAVNAAVSETYLPAKADQAKVTRIIDFMEKSKDPVFGATWLYNQGQITGETLTIVEEKAAEYAAKQGGTGKMANGITNPASQITGVTAANTAPKTGDNLELFGMDLSGGLGVLAPILAALGIGGAVTGAVRTKWPWQTAEGEGMIAPWSQMIESAVGWTQEGGVQGVGGAPGAFGGGTIGGTVVGGWTNAAKNGSTPATAEYLRMVDGKIYVRSLKTGVVKRVPRPRIVHLHSKMNLGTYIRAERMLDRMAGRIAKRTKSLKRQ